MLLLWMPALVLLLPSAPTVAADRQCTELRILENVDLNTTMSSEKIPGARRISEITASSLTDCVQACCTAVDTDNCSIAVFQEGKESCFLYQCFPFDNCVTFTKEGLTMTFIGENQAKTEPSSSTASDTTLTTKTTTTTKTSTTDTTKTTTTETSPPTTMPITSSSTKTTTTKTTRLPDPVNELTSTSLSQSLVMPIDNDSSVPDTSEPATPAATETTHSITNTSLPTVESQVTTVNTTTETTSSTTSTPTAASSTSLPTDGDGAGNTPTTPAGRPEPAETGQNETEPGASTPLLPNKTDEEASTIHATVTITGVEQETSTKNGNINNENNPMDGENQKPMHSTTTASVTDSERQDISGNGSSQLDSSTLDRLTSSKSVTNVTTGSSSTAPSETQTQPKPTTPSDNSKSTLTTTSTMSVDREHTTESSNVTTTNTTIISGNRNTISPPTSLSVDTSTLSASQSGASTTNISSTPTSVTSTQNKRTTVPTTERLSSVSDETSTTNSISMNTTLPSRVTADSNNTGQLNGTRNISPAIGQRVSQSNAVAGALIAALSFGIIFFFSVLVLLGKRCFDSWQRRHYSRMDYLINGMYN